MVKSRIIIYCSKRGMVRKIHHDRDLDTPVTAMDSPYGDDPISLHLMIFNCQNLHPIHPIYSHDISSDAIFMTHKNMPVVVRRRGIPPAVPSRMPWVSGNWKPPRCHPPGAKRALGSWKDFFWTWGPLFFASWRSRIKVFVNEYDEFWYIWSGLPTFFTGTSIVYMGISLKKVIPGPTGRFTPWNGRVLMG